MKKIVITAGGTGGHILPGLRIARECLHRGYEVTWIGAKGGLEEQIVTDNRIKTHFVDVRGLKGKNIIEQFKSIGLFTISLFKVTSLLRSIKPDYVIGFGGYASSSTGMACALLRIPLVLHEQNSVIGFTNSLLCRLSKLNIESFPNTFPKTKSKNTLMLGNPIEPFLKEKQSSKQDTAIKILILGGSRGAKLINETLPSVIQRFLDANPSYFERLEINHQCGDKWFIDTKSYYANFKCKYNVFGFMPDLDNVIESSDLIISRSGALTVSETCYFGKPSIQIPLPTAIYNHQLKNAEYLMKADAAVIVEQNDKEFQDKLFSEMSKLVLNQELRENMGKNAHSLQIYAEPQNWLSGLEAFLLQ